MSGSAMSVETSEQPPASSTTQHEQPRKFTALERNNLKWESHKDEIRNIYIEQDKTLKETMQWFEEKRGLDWSERKWKEKMKEWEFDKNIPAKEMAFMALKARKRGLDEGKETVFRRNGVLVDGNKIENFKRQKLLGNDIGERCIPATPQHISYETPKPMPNDGDQSTFSEMTHEEAKPGPFPIPETSPRTIDESRSAESNAATILAEKILALTSSTAKLDIDCSESNLNILRQGGLIDCPKVSDGHEFWDPICRLELFNDYIKSADQLFERGDRTRAEAEYCKAIQSYVDLGGDNNRMIINAVIKVAKCFKACNEEEVSNSARRCLNLLQTLIKNLWTISSVAYLLVSFELERLLYQLPGWTANKPNIDLYWIIVALHKLNYPGALYTELQSFLEAPPKPPKESDLSDDHLEQSALLLHLFTLRFEKYLRSKSPSQLALAVEDLYNAIFFAQVLKHRGIHDCLAQRKIKNFSSLKQILRESSRQESDFHEHYSLVQTLVTELASQFSVLGWYYAAEILFRTLEHDLVGPQISYTNPRACDSTVLSKFRIKFQYCLHLERQKKHQQLLSFIDYEYMEFLTYETQKRGTYVDAEVLDQIVKIRIILRNFQPWEAMSSDHAIKIAALIKMLEEIDPLFLSSAGRRTATAGEERNGSTNWGDFDELDDCKSSNRFGITYTESMVTGLSLNYSALFK